MKAAVAWRRISEWAGFVCEIEFAGWGIETSEMVRCAYQQINVLAS